MSKKKDLSKDSKEKDSEDLESQRLSELKHLETDVDEDLKKYFFGDDKLIDFEAIQVFAGYHWAKYNNFGEVYDESKYVSDRDAAIRDLKNIYEGKSISDIIDAMINRQAEVIWLRRQKEGIEEQPGNYDRDRWEAKRFVAYLFFDKIIYDCINDRICPDYKINLIDDEIVNLLKSLSVEEYCRIKAYLSFLDDRESNGYQAYHKNVKNYYDAMNWLNKAFQNCKCRLYAAPPKAKLELLLGDMVNIKKAKKNPEDRIGPISEEVVEEYVENYFKFMEDVISCKKHDEKPTEVLSALYDACHTKVINMAEFMSRCVVASYVEQRVHVAMRDDFGKSKIRDSSTQQINPQVESFFFQDRGHPQVAKLELGY